MDQNEKGRQVLLVEDVELNQQLAKTLLEAKGLIVDLAINGKEAVEKVENKHYDLVLMDIHMPLMDGVEATRRIRALQDPRRAAIPIVALTANSSPVEDSYYRHYGMNDVIAKPIDDLKFTAILKRYTALGADQLCSMPKPKPESFKQSPGTQLYDLGFIRSISGGDEAFVQQMIQIFITAMPVNMEDLDKAVQSQDWEATWKAAHKMKSTIDSMQIISLKQVIRDIEIAGRKVEAVEKIPALRDQVAQVIGECIRQLKEGQGQ